MTTINKKFEIDKSLILCDLSRPESETRNTLNSGIRYILTACHINLDVAQSLRITNLS